MHFPIGSPEIILWGTRKRWGYHLQEKYYLITSFMIRYILTNEGSEYDG
jgi:hypothetical protein